MQLELPCVGYREEVLADPWVKQRSGKAEEQKEWHKYRPSPNQNRKDDLITIAQAIETALKCSLEQHERIAARPVMLEPKQVFGQRRHESTREAIRSQHCE